MKVFAISKTKDFYKIGTDNNTAKWYGKTEAVEKFIGNIVVGDEVEIKSEFTGGKNFLTYIIKGNSGSSFNKQEPSKQIYGQKSPEESEKIKRLSILSSVCTAVSALSGQLDQNTLPEYIECLYDRMYKKISI